MAAPTLTEDFTSIGAIDEVVVVGHGGGVWTGAFERNVQRSTDRLRSDAAQTGISYFSELWLDCKPCSISLSEPSHS
jgi:hypothetical protein